MKTSFVKYLTLIIILGLSVTAFAQTSYKLQYKFQKGQTYKFTNSIVTNIVQQAMGQEIKIDVTADAIQKFLVEDQNDSSMVLIGTLDSVVVRTKMPMRDTTMHLTNFKDKRTRITINPVGTILKKEQLDTLDAAAQQVQQLSNETLRFFDLPKEEIKTGGIWSSDAVDSVSIMGGQMISNSHTDYTLAGEEEKFGYKCVKITFAATSNNEGKTQMMGMDLFIEGTGKGTGTFYFAPNEGITILAEMQSDSDMTMATTGEQKMIIPITQSSKITQTYLK